MFLDNCYDGQCKWDETLVGVNKNKKLIIIII
jgi:hypothetical protein